MTANNKFLKLFLDSNKKTTEALFGIKEALNKINDQNALHTQILVKNTDGIENLGTGIKSMVKTFQWLLFALVIALICLAGAEKAIKLLPLLK